MNEKKKVFIVDDDVASAKALADFLKSQGFEVTHAADGEIALKLLEEQVPDIIILDIIMPKVDGFTVAKKIRYNEKTKQVPIIVFSAKEGMKDLFAMEGIKDYLVKPVNHSELLELLRLRLS